jgi:hypothetical protein
MLGGAAVESLFMRLPKAAQISNRKGLGWHGRTP